MLFEVFTHIFNCVTNMLMCFIWHRSLNHKYKPVWYWFIFLGFTIAEEAYVLFIGRDNLFSTLSIIITFLIVISMFKNSVFQKVLAVIYLYSIMAVIDVSAAILMYYSNSNPYLLLLLYVFYVIAVLVISYNLVLLNKMDWNKRMIGAVFLLPIWIFIVFISMVVYLRNYGNKMIYSDMVDSLGNYKSLPLILISAVMFCGIFVFIMNMIKKEITKNNIEIQIKKQKEFNQMNYKYYSLVQKEYNAAGKYRHDINNIVTMLYLFKDNDTEDMDNIVNQLKEKINNLTDN